MLISVTTNSSTAQGRKSKLKEPQYNFKVDLTGIMIWTNLSVILKKL